MKALGSLSDVGWVVDSQILISKLLEYYLYTDTSQSTIFQGNITSLPKTYYEYINRPEAMAGAMKQEFGDMLNRYFDAYQIDADAEPLGDDTSGYAISLFVEAIGDDGRKVNAGRAFELNTNGVKDAIRIANSGEGRDYIKNIVRSR